MKPAFAQDEGWLACFQQMRNWSYSLHNGFGILKHQPWVSCTLLRKTHHRHRPGCSKMSQLIPFFMACRAGTFSLMYPTADIRELTKPEFLHAIEIYALNHYNYTLLAPVRMVSLLFELPKQNTINEIFTVVKMPPPLLTISACSSAFLPTACK